MLNQHLHLWGTILLSHQTSGTVYVFNKFSGKEEWSYMPGYYLFNSPLSSPIVYGDDIFVGDDNGNMYSLDFSRKTGPVSPYLYYVAAIVVVIIGGLVAVRVLRKRRKGKE